MQMRSKFEFLKNGLYSVKIPFFIVATRDVEAIDRFHFGGWDSY